VYEPECPELISKPTLFKRVDFARYSDLHQAGRQLIAVWYSRAQESPRAPDDPFEAFIYLWIAFNGWASCVTGLEKDRDWIDALAMHPDLNSRFGELVADSDSTVRATARTFFGLLPVFKASALREFGIYVSPSAARSEVVTRYLEAGAKMLDPKCYLKHRAAHQPIPIDWTHALIGLYRVRNNLFHGQKAAYIENDLAIVSSAYGLLRSFLSESRYFNVEPGKPWNDYA